MDLETVLRDHGSRVTRARRLVWDVLTRDGEHQSAQDIADRVNGIDPSVNVSSVYRALTLFAELGLVRESHLDGMSTWEPFHGDTAIHLMCTACGRVFHHHTDRVLDVRRDLDRHPEFVPDSIDVRVAGRCRQCVESPSSG